MSERLVEDSSKRPTPEQAAAAEGILTYFKDVVVKSDQWRKESSEPDKFNDRLTRYLRISQDEGETYLIHMHRGGGGVDLQVASDEGYSSIGIYQGGRASWKAKDSDGNVLVDQFSTLLTPDHIMFADAVIEVFKNTPLDKIEPASLADIRP